MIERLAVCVDSTGRLLTLQGEPNLSEAWALVQPGRATQSLSSSAAGSSVVSPEPQTLQPMLLYPGLKYLHGRCKEAASSSRCRKMDTTLDGLHSSPPEPMQNAQHSGKPKRRFILAVDGAHSSPWAHTVIDSPKSTSLGSMLRPTVTGLGHTVVRRCVQWGAAGRSGKQVWGYRVLGTGLQQHDRTNAS